MNTQQKIEEHGETLPKEVEALMNKLIDDALKEPQGDVALIYDSVLAAYTLGLTKAAEIARNKEATEADGWENAKKENCCPGDDWADGFNSASDDIAKAIEAEMDKL